MAAGSIWVFIVAIMLIAAAPGPGMAVVVRTAALRGFRATVPVVVGMEIGLYVWALLAGAGLASLIAASQVAYDALRVVGAGVLLVLGVLSWRTAWHSRRPASSLPDPNSRDDAASVSAVDSTSDGATPRRRPHEWVSRLALGAATNLANPKAALFMFAFYPQFIPPGRALLPATALLAAVQIVIDGALYACLAAMVGRASGWFLRPTVRRRLEATSGTVFIALGLKVAAAAR